jgi:nicotinamidase/pyrazinamidase
VETPSFYDPARVGTFFEPRTVEAVKAGHGAKLKPAREDEERVLLLLVDPQVDFVHEDGALSVPGAVADTRRTIEWLFKNNEQVTGIVASLDTHTPLQIFYPTWWMNAEGEHPAPFTPITGEEVDAGVWIPTIEPEWSREYVMQLEETAKKTLMIWPYHTMVGTPGHAITPALYEAIAYHATTRDHEPVFVAKGSIPKTEHYSILEPEVKVASTPLGGLNLPLINLIASYDVIYMAGQAKSHCVLETVTSLVRYFGEHRPEFIRRWRLLEDCTSSVAHPEIDFDALADEQLGRFAELGLEMRRSTDPIG